MPTVDRDGSAFFYEERGSGNPAIVFVHAAGTHEHYAHQIAHFSRAHRVVAPDLPGYGRSDPPAHGYSIPGFADDVAWLCDRLDVRDAVVVGHSMAGPVALEIAVARPDLVSLVVQIDPVPFAPAQRFRQALAPFVESLKGPGYREAVHGFAQNIWFRPSDDPVMRARVADEIAAQRQEVLVGTMASSLHWEGEKIARQVQVPVLMITNGDGIPTEMQRTREILPQLEIGRTVGVGHFGHLLDPTQANAMIDRFLSVATKRA